MSNELCLMNGYYKWRLIIHMDDRSPVLSSLIFGYEDRLDDQQSKSLAEHLWKTTVEWLVSGGYLSSEDTERFETYSDAGAVIESLELQGIMDEYEEFIIGERLTPCEAIWLANYIWYSALSDRSTLSAYETAEADAVRTDLTRIKVLQSFSRKSYYSQIKYAATLNWICATNLQAV